MGANQAIRRPQEEQLLPNQNNIHMREVNSNQDESQEGGVTHTLTIASEAHIQSDTIKLEQDPEYPHIYVMKFKYDSTKNSTIRVYMLHYEIIAADGSTSFHASDSRQVPQPKVINVRPGFDQQVVSDEIKIDTSTYSAAELGFLDRRTFPIIIEMVIYIQEPIQPDISQRELTYISLINPRNMYIIRVIKQILIVENQRYEISEIFGTPKGEANDQETNECAVCMTNEKDTVVLPCKHMCLCFYCANIMRSQPNSKCPICRQGKDYVVIETLMQILVDE